MRYKIVSEWKDTGSGTALRITAVDMSTNRHIQGVPNLEASYEAVVDLSDPPLGDPTPDGARRHLEEALARIVEQMRSGAERVFEQ